MNMEVDLDDSSNDEEVHEITELAQMKILEDTYDGRTLTIRISDCRLLNQNVNINDGLIEFYMNYVHSLLNDESKDKTYVFTTYFYTALVKPINPAKYDPSLSRSKLRHNKVARWTKKVDIFKKDFIFIPVNKNNHWSLAVICFPYLSGKVDIQNGTPVNEPDNSFGRYHVPKVEPRNPELDEADPNVEDLWLFDICSPHNYRIREGGSYQEDTRILRESKRKKILVKRPCILIFDSLSGGTQSASISATIREWLTHEYSTKHNGEQKDFSVMKACSVRVPQQPNYSDCGLFIMHFFEMFYSRPIVDFTFPILHLANWFQPSDIVKNGKKRRDLYNLIIQKMNSKGSLLPEGVEVPVPRFSDDIEENDDKDMNEEEESEDEEEEEDEGEEEEEESEDEEEEEEEESFPMDDEDDGVEEYEENSDDNDGNVYMMLYNGRWRLIRRKRYSIL